MKAYRLPILLLLSLFAITLLGAYYSPTFEEQKSFLELFILMGSLLFIFSALVVFATIGFGSFSLYGAIFLAVVMGLYGVEGACLVIGMSYMMWGFIFAMEFLLFAHQCSSASNWFQSRYTFQNFYAEYRIFLPMIWLSYLLLESLPSWWFKEPKWQLHRAEVVERMKLLLG